MDSIECAPKVAVDKVKKGVHCSKYTLENIIVPVRGVWFCSSIAVPTISVSDAAVHFNIFFRSIYGNP